ncbi:MAG: hypothetical protein GF355_12370, partial [Candidatus Eisenbacteria bacterium]|nr:hypothetical protein [Candidatus Eisenbacteria bacterium]
RTLRDPDPAVVETALLSLWRLAPPEMPAEAIRISRSMDAAQRWKAAYALMRLTGAPVSGRTRIPGTLELPEPVREEPRRRLIELARDPVPIVRLQAVRGLGALPGAGVEELLERRLGDADPRVRIEAVRSLGHLAVPSERIAGRLDDPVSPVVLQTLRSLADCSDPESVLDLVPPRLDAKQVWIRGAALATAVDAALETRRRSLAEKLIRRGLRDEHWRVRAAAVELAAAQDGSPALLERVAPGGSAAWLSREDPRVAKLAVEPHLRGIAGRQPSLLPRSPLRRAVERWLQAEDEMVRAMTYDALITLAAERRERRPEASAGEGPSSWFMEVNALLHRALGDPSPDVRYTVVEGMTRLKPLRSPHWNLLSEAVRDPDPQVRRRAAGILRSHGVAVPGGPVDRIATPAAEELADILRTIRGMTTAYIETDRGIIELELFPVQAPLTVANFVHLARRGFYSGTVWHRVVPDFVAQDGCPRGDGWGGPGHTIRCEINTRRYGAGALGMALSGKDTGGSQFFLTHSPQPHLDGGYTVFGRLRGGWEVLNRLVPDDRILQIDVRSPSHAD